MQLPFKQLLVTALLPLSFSAQASSTLLVIDAASGQPLENAVVEIQAPGASSDMQEGRPEIVQRDAAFVPTVTAIPAGAGVSFPNRDITRHQVYSFSPPKVFSLDLYLKETPPPVYFEKAGVEVLGCNIHDQMQAFIVISDAPFYAVTDAQGRIDLSHIPEGRYPMRIWHPRLDDTHQQWWEGDINSAADRQVALTLAAVKRPTAAPSMLQQRFQQSLQHQGH